MASALPHLFLLDEALGGSHTMMSNPKLQSTAKSSIGEVLLQVGKQGLALAGREEREERRAG